MNYNKKFRELAESGCLPEDPENERLKKSTLTIMVAAFIFMGVIWGCMYFVNGYWLPGCIPFSYSIVSLLSLTLFIYSKRYNVFRASQVIFILLLPFFLQFSLGGFIPSSGVVLWSIMCPLGALAFYDVRTSFRWFIAFVIIVLVAFALNDTAARYFDNNIDEGFINAMFLMNIIGVSILVYLVQFYFVGKQSEMKRIVEERNKEISDSIFYARTIQSAILPSEKLISSLLPEHFILYKPKDIVSGDFYWVYQTENKVIYIAADCTGHGVPGAFMSMIGNSLLNEIIIEKGIIEADKILNELRQAIINTLGQTGASGEARDGMDASVCVWHKDTNELEFTGANNPLYLVRTGVANMPAGQAERNFKFFENDLAEIKGDKQPIGYEEGKEDPFTKNKIQLQKDDTIYIFSDGYQDQYGGPNNKKFMAKRFRQLFIDIKGKSMQEQKEILNNTIEGWKGNLEQIDDILVIGVRI